MNIQQLMTRKVKTVHPDTDLAAVAMVMWDGDCGMVPVVDDEQNMVGILTDRDICIALATRHCCAHDLKARDVMKNDTVHCCSPESSVQEVLDIMCHRQIHRLPVTQQGRLVGVISINDFVLATPPASKGIMGRTRKNSGLTADDIVNTLKGICMRTQEAAAA